MKKQIIVGLVLSAATSLGCGSPNVASRETAVATPAKSRSAEETASETLNRMLEVATQGDWGAYVDQHYGEQDKFRSAADRDALVRRFEEKWGEKIVPGLQRAAQLPVQLEGEKALFLDGDDPVFVLHRGEGGTWKFHL